MAVAYGEFRFQMSEDCLLEGENFALALKRFRWDSSGGEWLFDREAKGFAFSDAVSEYPTVCPEFIEHCYCSDSSGDYEKCSKDMTLRDWECLDDFDSRESELVDLKEVLVPHIKNGYITISYECSQRGNYAFEESGQLTVNCTGKLDRQFLRRRGTRVLASGSESI